MDRTDRWIHRHFEELVDRHPGRWAVIVDGRLLGISRNLTKLTHLAKEKYPKKKLALLKIPQKQDLVCALNIRIQFTTD